MPGPRAARSPRRYAGAVDPARQARLDALPARLRAAARADVVVRRELARHVRGEVAAGYALGRVAAHLGHLETIALAHGPGRSGWPAQLCQWRWPDGTRCLGAGVALRRLDARGFAMICADCLARQEGGLAGAVLRCDAGAPALRSSRGA